MIRQKATRTPGTFVVPRPGDGPAVSNSRTLLSQLRDAPDGRRVVLHFAGHGSFDHHGNPALEFSGSDLLTADDIRASLKRPLDLAVLSGCSTNADTRDVDVDAPEAPSGNRLTEALRSAGARTVLVTSWDVSDQDVVNILGDFWEHWLNGDTAGDALVRAVRAAKKRGQAVRNWAAFRLYGDLPASPR